jgi:long-chain acyl-CoA synthetase
VAVLNAGVRASEAELLEHCRRLLAPYKLPRSVAFSAKLPRTGSGKVLKAVLVLDTG